MICLGTVICNVEKLLKDNIIYLQKAKEIQELPKEERLQYVVEIHSKITTDSITSGFLFYALLNLFGLTQDIYQNLSKILDGLLPEVKNHRNIGIREHNNYRRHITDKKIQNVLESNLDTFISSGGVDKAGRLSMELDYLTKYRFINNAQLKTTELPTAAAEYQDNIVGKELKKEHEKLLASINV